MNAPVGSISRRRVLQAAAWTAPIIVLATSVPAAAASVVARKGAFVTSNNLTLVNLTGVGAASFNFGLNYQAYNDAAAFAGTGVEAYQAAADPSFANWSITWVLDILNASNAVVHTKTANVVIAHGGNYTHPVTNITVPVAGNHRARLTVTSGQVSTVKGVAFSMTTLATMTAAVAIT